MYGAANSCDFHPVRTGRSTILGAGPRTVPPAWKYQPLGPTPHAEAGSRIFIAGLPTDVDKEQIQELMENTIGRVRDTFCVYNKAGKATGMAVVHFAKPGDALRARTMYNNKIIDQRQPIKVDLIVDSIDGLDLRNMQAPSVLPPRTLLDRLTPFITNSSPNMKPQYADAMRLQRQRALTVQARAHAAPLRQRRRKGPRQLQKHGLTISKTIDELDKEMEDYRKKAPRLEGDR